MGKSCIVYYSIHFRQVFCFKGAFMQKWLLPLVASCFSVQVALAADDMSLEGIVILGAQKSAVVLNNGKQVTVKAGDTLGEWTVDAIEARQIFLRNIKGERKELKLKTNLNAATPSPDNKPADGMAGMGMQQGMNAAPPIPPANNPFAAAAAANAAAAKNATPAPPTGQPAGQGFQPKVIEDKDIPAGHRRIRTPFGDVLVKDPPQ
jgi:hypothetical protein